MDGPETVSSRFAAAIPGLVSAVRPPGPPSLASQAAQAIAAHAAELGLGAASADSPTPRATPAPRSDGFWQRFERGWVYWTPRTGAHWVTGAIFAKWAELRWEQGFLGFPLTDESPTPDGVGRFNHFEGGSIYWTPGIGAHEVHGAIRELWAKSGWELGELGYPTSDEMDSDDGAGRRTLFQYGAISWDPKSGARIEAATAERAGVADKTAPVEPVDSDQEAPPAVPVVTEEAPPTVRIGATDERSPDSVAPAPMRFDFEGIRVPTEPWVAAEPWPAGPSVRFDFEGSRAPVVPWTPPEAYSPAGPMRVDFEGVRRIQP